MAEESTRPASVEEMEADLRLFLKTIRPITSVVIENRHRTAPFIIAKATKNLMNKDAIKNFADLGPLLEKYQYLMDGQNGQ